MKRSKTFKTADNGTKKTFRKISLPLELIKSTTTAPNWNMDISMIDFEEDSEYNSFDKMPRLQRMVYSRQQQHSLNGLHDFSPASSRAVRLMQSSPEQSVQAVSVDCGSAPYQRQRDGDSSRDGPARRVFICQQNSARGRGRGRRSIGSRTTRHDHNFCATTAPPDLRNGGEPLSPSILAAESASLESCSNDPTVYSPRTRVLVMLLDLSGVRDAIFQQVEQGLQKDDKAQMSSKMVQFKQMSEFPTIWEFRKWFAEENEDRVAWRLVGRMCFALKPFEVHVYMCKLCDRCPCLLAVRYSLLFDEVRVYHARQHVHNEQQKQEREDDDVQIIWPPPSEKSCEQNANSLKGQSPTSMTSGSSSPQLVNAVGIISVSQDSTLSPSVSDPLHEELANSETGSASTAISISPALAGDCEKSPSSKTSNSSSQVGPAEDLLSKVLQEVDIPHDCGMNTGSYSKVTREGDGLTSTMIRFDNDSEVVVAREEEVTTSCKNSKGPSILGKRGEKIKMQLGAVNTPSSSLPHAAFTVTNGISGVDTRWNCLTSGINSEGVGAENGTAPGVQKRRIWRLVPQQQRFLNEGVTLRGTIKVRRVQSVQAVGHKVPGISIYEPELQGITVVAPGEGCFQSQPIDALTMEQIEALRLKRKTKPSSIVEPIKQDESEMIEGVGHEVPIEKGGIMADELMDCLESELVSLGHDVQQTSSGIQQLTVGDTEQQVQNGIKDRHAFNGDVDDGSVPSLSSSLVSSPFWSDKRRAEEIVNQLLCYMKGSLSPRDQRVCCKRILKVLDTVSQTDQSPLIS
ncbi:hypothetical protein Tcan_12671 [Toxocara canis]|uniref:Uncharacterized protein n=1 Tax=Toxocara canis TaxID=6265 RepID=A0A0B2V955_TOXCA|nr:hypothetical protein Tcan_12671 [Toxocara canis]